MKIQDSEHYKHQLVMWQSTMYLAKVGDEDLQEGDSQFDEETPVFCKECEVHLPPEEDRLFREAITKLFQTIQVN